MGHHRLIGVPDGHAAHFPYLTAARAAAWVTDSKITRSVGRRQHPAERQRSRVVAVVGSGGGLEGYLLAGEAFELAEEVTGLAVAVDAGLVVVGAEVVVAGGGVG